jgi:hypothetical protein
MNLPETKEATMERKWAIYVDGSSTKMNGGVGIFLITPDKEELSSSVRLEFKTTNNEAEYEGYHSRPRNGARTGSQIRGSSE